jgi:hypothetical protein
MRPLRKLVATNPIVRKHDEPLQLTENGRMFVAEFIDSDP